MYCICLFSSSAPKAGDVAFVQTGNSVQLDIQQEIIPPFEILFWLKDEAGNLLIFSKENVILYNDRIDFNNKTFSLILKNVQKSDSGVYKAQASGKKEICVAEHKVIVIGESGLME